MRACWRHSLSDAEVRALRAAGFPAVVLHGRHDLLADARWGERLAARLGCPALVVDGAHFIVRECAPFINFVLYRMLGSSGIEGAARVDPWAAAAWAPPPPLQAVSVAEEGGGGSSAGSGGGGGGGGCLGGLLQRRRSLRPAAAPAPAGACENDVLLELPTTVKL
jgi:uncharacterized membrane protein YgcG